MPRSGTAKRRKSRRKLKFKDRAQAALIAGILVAAAIAASLVVIFLHANDIKIPAPEASGTVLPDREARSTEAPPPETLEEIAVRPAAVSEKPKTETPRPPVRTSPDQSLPETSKPVPQAQPKPPVQTPPAQNQPKSTVQAPPAQPPPAQTQPVRPQPAPVSPPVPAGLPERPPERRELGKLVFVIDDAGNNLRELEPFLRFPGPLTIAVLPGLANSAEAARRIRAAGKEVFLHQPMEPLGGQNPGPGAVYAGMSAQEIRTIINRNLDEIWPVAGLNNHEGSKVTMDEAAMEVVLEICRTRGILFLDSRTTAETKAPIIAQRYGMKIGERDVFLDNSQDKASILSYINTGRQRAEQRGAVIMIGHTWTPALAPLLEENYADWLKKGYSLSTVSALIRGGL